MNDPAYPVARAVADAIASHFACLHAAPVAREVEGPAPQPDAASVEALIDVAFWASLLRQEGHDPRISLAFVPPDQARETSCFSQRLPLGASVLARLAPAVERPGVHLGVWPFEGKLEVWGIARSLPTYCFVLEVVEPGLLVAKYRRDEAFGKFGNVAVLDGDQIKLVSEDGEEARAYPAMLQSVLRMVGPAASEGAGDILIQLAASMRAHRRGGALLVVPGGSQRWRDSLVWPVTYLISSRSTALAALLSQDPAERAGRRWQDGLRRAIDAVAGLTAVDGATVVTDRYELLAFGAKIGRAEGDTPVEQVVASESVVGSVPAVVHPTRLGGTRHLSAAQFVHDQHDALALVASQDGRFTVFAWSEDHGMVHAHRIETLLL